MDRRPLWQRKIKNAYLAENDIKLVMVNPYHEKQSKEMDDNSQTKNDRKDPKVIAKLVTE